MKFQQVQGQLMNHAFRPKGSFKAINTNFVYSAHKTHYHLRDIKHVVGVFAWQSFISQFAGQPIYVFSTHS